MKKRVKSQEIVAKNKRRQNYIVDGFFMYFLFNYTFHHDYVHIPIALIFIFLIFYLAQDSTRLIDC